MKTFNQIYFECNIKPLHEEVLREMAIINKDQFKLFLENSLSSICSKNFKLNTEIIEQIIDVIVLNNNTIQDPFAIVENNEVLLINNASEEYKNKLDSLITRKYPSFTIRTINNSEPVNLWVTNVINTLFISNKIIRKNIIVQMTQETFFQIVQTNFNQLYLALQRGQLTR